MPASTLGASERFFFVADEAGSLHHFLAGWAKTKGDDPANPQAPRAEMAAWSAEERETWEAALTFYRREIAPRELLWDLGMIRLRDHQLGLWQLFPSDEINLAAVAQLRQAAPIYRRYFWPRHLEAARAWVAAYLALPALAEREREIDEGIAPIFGGPLPTARVRVDLAPYADQFGAYTTVGPHVTISSLDPGYQGEAALEMVFHEAAHGDLTSDPLRHAIDAAYAQRGKRAPFNLQHAIHFYSVGEIARAVAAEHGIAYQRYDEAQGVLQRAWPHLREPLGQHWRPVLEGRADRDAALASLVDAVIAAAG